jgi:hypothetical protein
MPEQAGHEGEGGQKQKQRREARAVIYNIAHKNDSP